MKGPRTTTEDREVLGDVGIIYESVEDLRAKLQALTDDPASRLPYRERAMNRARRYSWEAVTDQYENLFYDMAGKPRTSRSEAQT